MLNYPVLKQILQGLSVFFNVTTLFMPRRNFVEKTYQPTVSLDK
ncbi:hypothetical protein THERMOS_320 [Bathymodiolus thermophilus thioautotrophic gill symbiont]|uniref:Uncharacterized protein n=1 Tax=Bathymodiolus thermophilus thioautotrophic gill symbiont TaxID=2360 RepID=A0A8H8XAG5_9GAMM|nr:hypothetical protein THERMOS_320 [Bathymodiolus thermophilus thioautotrophic gill symbiont]